MPERLARVTASKVKTECAWELEQACADLNQAELQDVELYPRRIERALAAA
jgi:hypothetical protein